MKLDDWIARHDIPAASEDSVPEMVWIDLESTGLNKQDRGRVDHPLEIGLVLTDRYGCPMPDDAALYQSVIVDRKSWGRIVDVMNEGNPDENDVFVRNLHTSNGLWEDLLKAWQSLPNVTASTFSPEQVGSDVLDWIEMWGIGTGEGYTIDPKTLPLCGSSLRFDRDLMACRMQPVDDFFSYRVVDVSSDREVMRMQRPDLMARLDAETSQHKSHRVLDDIGDSIKLYRFMLEKFFRLA